MSTQVDRHHAPTDHLRDGAFGHATDLSCRECGHQVDARPVLRVSGVLRPARGRLRLPGGHPGADRGRPKNIWRYKALLPVPDDIEQSPNMEPGFTRLLKADNLGRELGIDHLWVKDDSGNPTHSFKDRVVAFALSAARELGSKVFACPSTGNLANAVAAAGARAGIKTVVFIPANLEQPKQVNTAVYADTLVAVNGNYDDVNRLASEIAGEEDGWAFVNVNVRPYYAEGSKTLGLRDRRAARLAAARPDRHPGRLRLAADQGRQGVPRADQARAGRGQAVQDLRRAGHRLLAGLDRLQGRPRRVRPVKPDTIAKSLAIGNPADGTYVLDICRRTGGAVEDVTDDEVREGILLLARTEGIFAETAGGTTVAVLKKLVDDGCSTRRGDSGDQHRQRAQDPRRRGGPGRCGSHDRPVVRRVHRERRALAAKEEAHERQRPDPDDPAHLHRRRVRGHRRRVHAGRGARRPRAEPRRDQGARSSTTRARSGGS